MAERQSCKLKVLGSIPSGGFPLPISVGLCCLFPFGGRARLRSQWPHTRNIHHRLLAANTGLEPTIAELDVLRLAQHNRGRLATAAHEVSHKPHRGNAKVEEWQALCVDGSFTHSCTQSFIHGKRFVGLGSKISCWLTAMLQLSQRTGSRTDNRGTET